MSEFGIVLRAVAGEVTLYDHAAAILLADALDIEACYGSDLLTWQETLWAAHLAMEEVFRFDANSLTEELLHTAMNQKILRIINGLDREQMDALRRRPDAYVNRLFGVE
ncbi:MAG: hypothetical protein ACM3ZQ_11345 [Bacillota bacterium]